MDGEEINLIKKDITEGIERQNATDRKIDLLDDHLHAINIKLNTSQRKSWLSRNSSLLISILALSISVGFSVYGIGKENEKDEQATKSQKVKKIEELTIKLTDIAEKNIKLTAENPNINLNNLSVLFNYRKLIYIKEITKLIGEVKYDFPPDMYAIIGNELKFDGQYEKAKDFYLLEKKNSTTSASKVVAYRDLGHIYGIPNTPVSDIDSSNYYRKLSITESDHLFGEQKYIIKGYSFQLWAADEFYKGNVHFANQLVDSSRTEYLKLPDNNMSLQNNLRMLTYMTNFENQKDITKTFFGLAGEWSSSSSNNVQQLLYFYQNSSGWFCTLEIFESGKISYSLSGKFLTVANGHLTFDVSGMKRISGKPYTDRIQVLGSLKLFPNKNNQNSIEVELNEINGANKKFIISKN